MRASTGPVAAALIALAFSVGARAATTDDFIFIHHSCGSGFLNGGLHDALLAKDYIDERNDTSATTSPTAWTYRRTPAAPIRSR